MVENTGQKTNCKHIQYRN